MDTVSDFNALIADKSLIYPQVRLNDQVQALLKNQLQSIHDHKDYIDQFYDHVSLLYSGRAITEKAVLDFIPHYQPRSNSVDDIDLDSLLDDVQTYQSEQFISSSSHNIKKNNSNDNEHDNLLFGTPTKRIYNNNNGYTILSPEKPSHIWSSHSKAQRTEPRGHVSTSYYGSGAMSSTNPSLNPIVNNMNEYKLLIKKTVISDISYITALNNIHKRFSQTYNNNAYSNNNNKNNIKIRNEQYKHAIQTPFRYILSNPHLESDIYQERFMSLAFSIELSKAIKIDRNLTDRIVFQPYDTISVEPVYYCGFICPNSNMILGTTIPDGTTSTSSSLSSSIRSTSPSLKVDLDSLYIIGIDGYTQVQVLIKNQTQLTHYSLFSGQFIVIYGTRLSLNDPIVPISIYYETTLPKYDHSTRQKHIENLLMKKDILGYDQYRLQYDPFHYMDDIKHNNIDGNNNKLGTKHTSSNTSVSAAAATTTTKSATRKSLFASLDMNDDKNTNNTNNNDNTNTLLNDITNELDHITDNNTMIDSNNNNDNNTMSDGTLLPSLSTDPSLQQQQQEQQQQEQVQNIDTTTTPPQSITRISYLVGPFCTDSIDPDSTIQEICNALLTESPPPNIIILSGPFIDPKSLHFQRYIEQMDITSYNNNKIRHNNNNDILFDINDINLYTSNVYKTNINSTITNNNDNNNNDISSIPINISFQTYFDYIIQLFVTHLNSISNNITLILIPSIDDIHHVPTYPQPAFTYPLHGVPYTASSSSSSLSSSINTTTTTGGGSIHIYTASNPAMLDIDGVLFGMTSYDVLRELSGQEQYMEFIPASQQTLTGGTTAINSGIKPGTPSTTALVSSVPSTATATNTTSSISTIDSAASALVTPSTTIHHNAANITTPTKIHPNTSTSLGLHHTLSPVLKQRMQQQQPTPTTATATSTATSTNNITTANSNIPCIQERSHRIVRLITHLLSQQTFAPTSTILSQPQLNDTAKASLYMRYRPDILLLPSALQQFIRLIPVPGHVSTSRPITDRPTTNDIIALQKAQLQSELLLSSPDSTTNTTTTTTTTSTIAPSEGSTIPQTPSDTRATTPENNITTTTSLPLIDSDPTHGEYVLAINPGYALKGSHLHYYASITIVHSDAPIHERTNIKVVHL